MHDFMETGKLWSESSLVTESCATLISFIPYFLILKINHSNLILSRNCPKFSKEFILKTSLKVYIRKLAANISNDLMVKSDRNIVTWF